MEILHQEHKLVLDKITYLYLNLIAVSTTKQISLVATAMEQMV